MRSVIARNYEEAKRTVEKKKKKTKFAEAKFAIRNYNIAKVVATPETREVASAEDVPFLPVFARHGHRPFYYFFFSWFMFWFLTSLRFLPRLAFVIKMAKTKKKKLYKYIDLSKEVVTSSERTKLLRWTTTIPKKKKKISKSIKF